MNFLIHAIVTSPGWDYFGRRATIGAVCIATDDLKEKQFFF
jgi:hypothetical protein